MKIIRYAALVTVAVIMSTPVVCAAESGAALTPQSVTHIAKIAGSVIQTTVRSMERVTPIVPTGSGDITAVCITSGSNGGSCTAAFDAATLAQAGCTTSADSTPTAGCGQVVSPRTAQRQHVAMCDADDIGLSGCLAKYAASLVKHPGAAEKVYQFSVRRDSKDMPDVTVLVTAKQSEDDAARMAVNSMSTTMTASRD